MMNINIIAILLAALVSTLISLGWYAVFLEKNSGVKKEEIVPEVLVGKPRKVFLTSFVANLFATLALAILLNIFQAGTFFAGMKVAFAVWLLLVGLAGIKKILIDKKSFANFALGAGHDFVSILTAVCILISFAD